MAFFPQLVAGPIVRWTTMGHQIETPRPFRPDYLGLGVALMVVGLFQKIVLADGIFAPVADAHFSQASLESGLSAWVGALAFTGQITYELIKASDCTFADKVKASVPSADRSIPWSRWGECRTLWKLFKK